MHYKNVAILLFVLSALVVTGCDGIQNRNSKEQMMGEVVIACSTNFKSPSSLRVISGSGSLSRSEEGNINGFAYLYTSAKNSMGTNVSDMYVMFIGSDGIGYIMDEENFPTYFKDYEKFKKRDDFDIEAVNKVVENYWKKLGIE